MSYSHFQLKPVIIRNKGLTSLSQDLEPDLVQQIFILLHSYYFYKSYYRAFLVLCRDQ